MAKSIVKRASCLVAALALAAAVTACGNVEDNKFWNAPSDETASHAG